MNRIELTDEEMNYLDHGIRQDVIFMATVLERPAVGVDVASFQSALKNANGIQKAIKKAKDEREEDRKRERQMEIDAAREESWYERPEPEEK